MKNYIIAEFVAVTILVFVADYIFSTNLPEQNIGTIAIVIGATWLAGSILCLGFKSLEQSLISLFLSFILICLGGATSDYNPKKFTDEEIGMTDKAEWLITISYKNEYGFSDSERFKFVGNTTNAYQESGRIQAQWEFTHPQLSVENVERTLTYIPPDYAKRNHYPKELARRY